MCILDYGASGYNRDEKTTDQLDELAREISRKFKNGSGIYLARLGRFLHSKLLLAETSGQQILGAVGSLNFTRRGFLDNEEVMYAVRNPTSIQKYFKGILEGSRKIPLDMKFVQADTASYREWMLAGSIFYEDRESNPFNFKLGIPEELRAQNSNVIPGEKAQTSDYYPLTKLLGISSSRKQSWKKFCISTCYGCWCPKQLVEKAREEIAKGADQDAVKRIKPILDSEKILRQRYVELFDKIEGNIKKLGNGSKQWDRDKTQKKLEKWLSRVIKKLKDESVLRRLLSGVSGPVVVPNFWASDNLAAQEFEQSFCDHIVIEVSKKSKFNRIAQCLNEIEYSSFPSFDTDDWEQAWFDESKWLEWLHQQNSDPFCGLAEKPEDSGRRLRR